MAEIEFTDRYKALGMLPPDLETMCEGQCEGTGFVPIYMPHVNPGDCHPAEETDPEFIRLWFEAEKVHPSDDGYHFVKCPDCKGTGKK